MPKSFYPHDCAGRLSDCCSASLDLVEALRAGGISPADNLGSGKTAVQLLAATIFAVESIHRASHEDQKTLTWGMQLLTVAWRERIVAQLGAAP